MFFFFPDIAADIDWEREYEFLDQELQKITRQASSAQGRVDKLVRIRPYITTKLTPSALKGVDKTGVPSKTHTALKGRC